MKKLVSLVLAVIMLMGIANISLAEEKTLTFWSLMSGGEADVVQAITDAYNATNPEYKVEHTMLESAEYYTKLVTAVSGGVGPDIGISHVAKLPELVRSGVVMSMDDVAEKAGFDWSILNETIMTGCVVDGGTYAVPMDTHCQLLFYNRALLKDFLNEDGTLTPPKGGAEFTAWLQEIQATLADGQYAMAINNTKADTFRMWWSMYYQDGGDPVITSDLEIKLDKEKFAETLSYLKSWYDIGVAPKNMTDSNGMFVGGNAALTLQGCWKNYVYEQMEELDYGVCLYPQVFGDDDSYAVWGDSHTLIMPYNANITDERKAAIFDFLSFFSNNSVMWANAGHIVANKAVVASDEFKALPYRSDYVDEANYVVFFEPNQYSYPIRDILIANIGAYLTDTISIDEAFDESIAEIEETIN